MKTPHIALLAATLLAGAGAAQAADLTITVTDIRSTDGWIGIEVVDAAAAWNGEAAAVMRQRLPASATPVVFRFSGLPAGRYAVQVLHDENGNGKLDANFLGMPTEGYGFSNNPRVLRKPTFEEAGFDLADAGGEMTIQLR